MILPYVFNNGTEHDSTLYDATTTNGGYGYTSPYFNDLNDELNSVVSLGLIPQSILINEPGGNVHDDMYDDTSSDLALFPMFNPMPPLHSPVDSPLQSPASSPISPLKQVIFPTDALDALDARVPTRVPRVPQVHSTVHSTVPTPLPPQFAASVIFASSPSAASTSTSEPMARKHPAGAPGLSSGLSSGLSIDNTPETGVYEASSGDGGDANMGNHSLTSNTSLGDWWN